MSKTIDLHEEWRNGNTEALVQAVVALQAEAHEGRRQLRDLVARVEALELQHHPTEYQHDRRTCIECRNLHAVCLYALRGRVRALER